MRNSVESADATKGVKIGSGCRHMHLVQCVPTPAAQIQGSAEEIKNHQKWVWLSHKYNENCSDQGG